MFYSISFVILYMSAIILMISLMHLNWPYIFLQPAKTYKNALFSIVLIGLISNCFLSTAIFLSRFSTVVQLIHKEAFQIHNSSSDLRIQIFLKIINRSTSNQHRIPSIFRYLIYSTSDV